MTARSLVEGLFGVFIDALHDTLHVRPGFPANWNHASISTPDLAYEFKRKENLDHYHFKLSSGKRLNLSLQLPAQREDVQWIVTNGKNIKWRYVEAIGQPIIQLQIPSTNEFSIQIKWKGKRIEFPRIVESDSTIQLLTSAGSFLNLFDPQRVLSKPDLKSTRFSAEIVKTTGSKTFFVQVRQAASTYWLPVSFERKQLFKKTKTGFAGKFESIDLSNYFNDQVSNIFKNQYLSPRPKGPTLQLPTQGIGNWAYPLVMPNISDSGLRERAGIKNEFTTGEGIPFKTPSAYNERNILFTSLWDNYPDSATIPLTGKASHIHLLMAGSTNPMQSRMVNGEIIVQYQDGSEDKLSLKNPENWWPIEQDLYDDGYAFTTDAPKPVRVYFKTGEDTRTFNNYTALRGFSNRAIDGGAGTILDLAVDSSKELRSLTVKTIANDVVIGLMSLTLVR
jgi:hypothetical protein